MQRQPSQFETGSLPAKVKEWHDTGLALAMLMALPLIVIMRKKPGFRRLSLGALFSVFAGLLTLNAIGNFHFALPFIGNIGATSQSESLKYFGFAILGLGLFKRHQMWKATLQGERWHTYSSGISFFEWLGLRMDLIYRFVDPAVALIAGLVLRKLGFSGLGLFVVISALCLCMVEENARKKQLEIDLDTVDSLLDAEMQARTVAHFDEQHTEEVKPRSLRETGGIPTAADAGLEAEIARRKKQAAAKRGTTGNGSTEVYQ
jgi:hypothetical protein